MKGGDKMSIKMKDIIEVVLVFIFVVFAYGVGAYYDGRVYNELYGTTATTEIDYGNN